MKLNLNKITPILLPVILTGCLGVPKMSFNGYGTPKNQGCFHKHINEAITKNKARRKLYIAEASRESRFLSHRAKTVSKRFVFLEKISSLFAKSYYDYHAQQFQREGIPIMRDEFISMHHTPDFRARVALPKSEYKAPQTRYFRFVAKRKLEKNEFEVLAQITRREIKRLNIEPAYNCMYRHTLESLLRVTNFLQEYIDEYGEGSQNQGPALLWKDLIAGHIFSINSSVQLDKLAAPLQEKGIGIICQDVPHIPESTSIAGETGCGANE